MAVQLKITHRPISRPWPTALNMIANMVQARRFLRSTRAIAGGGGARSGARHRARAQGREKHFPHREILFSLPQANPPRQNRAQEAQRIGTLPEAELERAPLNAILISVSEKPGHGGPAMSGTWKDPSPTRSPPLSGDLVSGPREAF